MLPKERQNRIKELLQAKQYIKISELSTELGVSEMTIHRDLKPLINEGIVIKTFGGVSLVNESTHKGSASDECVYCGRKVTERLAYRLFLPNNDIETACCAHCGLLRHRQLDGQVVQAICPDFLRHTTISAPLAWFVMDTSIQMGCCHPQVLSFEWKETADKFVKGFGGEVYSFSEAVETIFQKMNGSDHCCKKQP